MEVHENLQNVSDNTPLSMYDWLFHEQDRNPRTSVTTAFFDAQNLEALNARIGQETGRLLNRPCVIVQPNNQFFLYLEDLLKSVSNLVDVAGAVARLNEIVLEHEVKEQYLSLRQRELFFKWFWFKDRPRVIDPPMNTNGRHRFSNPNPGAYNLTDPRSQHWAEFQRSQQVLACEGSRFPYS